MTREIDRNDVDISSLFIWNKEFQIKDEMKNREVTLYVRLAGDDDIGKARAYSFRRSAELRKRLKTPGTDEFVAFTDVGNDFTDKDVLVDTILILKVPELSENIRKNLDVPEPREPKDNASLEEMETYQRLLDEYPALFDEKLKEAINTTVAKERENYLKVSHEELLGIYHNLIINRLCTEEVNRAFYDMLIYLSIYKDSKFTKRAFKDITSFVNSSSYLKKRLLEEYQSLELGMDFLKKLPEATP